MVGAVVAAVVAGLVDVEGNGEVWEVAALAEPKEVEVDGFEVGHPLHWPWDSLKAKHLTINPSIVVILLSAVLLALMTGWQRVLSRLLMAV